MQIEITKDEQQQIMACIEAAIRSAPSPLQYAAILMPLAQKINIAKDDDRPQQE